MHHFCNQLYLKPWPHASPYFIGMAFGYLIFKNSPKKTEQGIILEKNKTHKNLTFQRNKRIIWTAIAVGFVLCLYDTYYWTFGVPNNKWISALVYPFTRILWSVVIRSVTWMCVTGNGGLMNRFLSWNAFTPLSRLNYSVYLTHIWITWGYWGSRRQLPPVDPGEIIVVVCYSLFYSYLLGFVFSVLFESPVSYFESYLKKTFSKSQNISGNNKSIEMSLNS